MPDICHCIDVFRGNGLLEPHEPKRLQRLCYFLSGRRVVATVHVASQVHVRRNRFAYVGDPLDHAIDLAVAGRPIDGVETSWIARIVEVDLHRGEALILDPWKLTVGFGADRNIHVRIAVNAYLVAELSAHELIDRESEGLAGEIPEGDFQTRQRGNVLPTLRSREDSQGADSLPDGFYVERITPDEHAAPASNQRSGSDGRIG